MVTILQRSLPHYRIAFFQGLRAYLAARGVRLRLIYGAPAGKDAKKGDQQKLPWAEEVELVLWAGERLVYHPVLGSLSKEKLVICEQANRNLINYLLMGWRRLGGPKLALWGHGRNRQATIGSAGNRFKKVYVGQSDWFFAYTGGVGEDLAEWGYPAERITIVGNSIDTRAFASDLEAVTASMTEQIVQQYGLSGSTCLYCGGMYPEKQIPLLLEACRLLAKRIPGFVLLAVGAGTDADLFEQAAITAPWLHYVGPKFGVEKASFYKASKLVLMPGLVGLAVLDSFVAGVPIATTEYPYHSPEIEYLDSGVNGLVTGYSVAEFANGVAGLLENSAELSRMALEAKEAAKRHSMEEMVRNFGDGILKVLAGVSSNGGQE
jgi:L-malate glycosyltransferase